MHNGHGVSPRRQPRRCPSEGFGVPVDPQDPRLPGHVFEDGIGVTSPSECAVVADESANADRGKTIGTIYCLSLSNALDLNVCAAVLGKLETNEGRYPAAEFRGAFV